MYIPYTDREEMCGFTTPLRRIFGRKCKSRIFWIDTKNGGDERNKICSELQTMQ